MLLTFVGFKTYYNYSFGNNMVIINHHSLKIHLILVFLYRDIKANPDPVSVKSRENIPINLVGINIDQDYGVITTKSL